MSSGALIFASPAAQGALALVAGKPVTVNPNCAGSAALITTPLLLNLIKAGGIAAQISCQPGVDPTHPRVGNLFVLDPAEGATLAAAINGYNAYIKSKADAIGFGYWDPNPTLTSLPASQKAPFPSFLPTNTFGTAFSLDGVHPSAEGQKIIANNLIGVINTKYGTTLASIP